MGRPKESLPFGASTLLGHTADLLLECTWPVLVVARGADQHLPPLPLDVTVVLDERPDAGPLAALATGLRALRVARDLTDRDAVFVTGCDAPFLTADTVGWLAGQLGDHQVVMPRADDVLQPLCAVYRMDILHVVEALLQEGVATPRSLAERANALILDEPELRRHDPQLRFLRSLNTPEDYEAARREAGA